MEGRLRHVFPRHHLQDEFMHIATIAAFFVAAIGFLLGMFTQVFLGMVWLLFAIALLLFLILRESTLPPDTTPHDGIHRGTHRPPPRRPRPSPRPLPHLGKKKGRPLAETGPRHMVA